MMMKWISKLVYWNLTAWREYTEQYLMC